MNRRRAIVSLAAGAAAAPLALGADAQIEDWVGWWERSKKFVLKIAEAMPAESYDFKPFPQAHSFGDEILHIGDSEAFYLERLGKGRAPAVPQNGASKAVALKYTAELFDWSIGVIKQLKNSDLTKSFGRGKEAMTGLDILLNTMVHTAHTRGYIDMYLRAKGITPPEYSV
jgi:uncharacterized damage-inducible protein DinB